MTNSEWIRSMSDEELCDFIQMAASVAVAGERIGLDARNLCNILWMHQKHKKVQKNGILYKSKE